MQFTVPKFLEREAKIVGPLTFKQLGIFAGAGMVSLLLYFVLSRALFFLFFFLIGGGAAALVFLKVEGAPLSEVLLRYLNFLRTVKTYIWQGRKVFTPMKLRTKTEKEKEAGKVREAPLKLSPKSELRNLASKLERGEK